MSSGGSQSLLSEGKLFEISPWHVDASGRIGFLHVDKAEAIGRLMAVDGQRDPIKVVASKADPEKPWKLVTGMHRLMGAQLEGLTIHAIEVTGKPEDLADLEASENLHRRPLAPIERAKFVHALCQAAQERIARANGGIKQHQLAIKARWDRVRAGEDRAEQALTDEVSDTSDKLSLVYGWVDSAAEAMGLGKRTINRALELYRLLIEPFPDLVEELARHPIVGENESQLREIAQVRDEKQRRRVIEALIEDPELGADMARARVGVENTSGPAPSPEQKIVSAAIGNLSRLSATAQKHHVNSIVRALKTDEVKRQLRDRLNEELGEASAGAEQPLDVSFLGGSHVQG